MKEFIFNLQRFEEIENDTPNILVNGTSGDDEIYNYEDATQVTINAGAGNDTIRNNGESSIIDGGAGNDFIDNGDYADNSTLNGGAGDDYIENTVHNASINGGDGNDTIDNTDYRDNEATIDGGAGNDSILNDTEEVLFVYSGGNDTISGFFSNSTLKIASGTFNPIIESDGTDLILSVGENKITLTDAYSTDPLNIVDASGNALSYGIRLNGTTGDDNLSNDKNNVTILAYAGADTIDNSGSNNSINGGEGNDEISNNGSNVTIDTGAGNNNIENHASKVTLLGGTGADSINNHSNSGQVSINSGDGANYIYNGGDYATLVSGSGNDTIHTSGNGYNVTINTGAGNDSIYSEGSGGTSIIINAEAGNDSITNESKNATINSGAGDDDIHNTGEQVSINSGDGNNFIYNSNSKVTITTGAGNDSIINKNSTVTITAGAGNDSIESEAESVSISGGVGDDTIDSKGSNSTIDSGAGNDSVKSEGDNVLFVYSGGDDIIEGFNSSSTLKIASGDLNPVVESNNADLIFSVGENKLTLKDAYSSETLNIVDASGKALAIKINLVGSADADSIFNNKDETTITGGAGDDTITNEGGAKLLINGGAGDDSITNNIKVTYNEKTEKYDTLSPDNSTLIGGDGDDTLRNEVNGDEAGGKNASIVGGNGNDEIYNDNSGGTITGDAGNDYITNWGANSFVNSGEGNDTVDNYGENVTINTGAGKNLVFNYDASNVIITGGDDNDTIENHSGSKMTIDSGNGNDVIFSENSSNVSINSGAGNNSINNSSSNVAILSGDGKDTIEISGEKITITSGAGNDSIENNATKVTITAGAGDDYIYNGGGNVLFNYNVGDGNDSIEGFNENATLQIGDGTDTFSKEIVDNDIVVTVGENNITLFGAAWFTPNITGKEIFNYAWRLNDTTATYGTTNQTLVTVEGVKSISGITLNDKVVTLSKAALDETEVTVSNGYTLALADDVAKSSTQKGWSLNKNTATYKQTTTAGYLLSSDKKSVSYVEQTSETFATVKGVKSVDGISLKDNVVTIAASALNQGKVTVSDDYTLKLGKDVSKPSTKKVWNLDGTTASYNQVTAAGYTLANDGQSISYTKAASKTLATVKGVKSADGISAKDKVITVSAAALDTDTVTVSDGYTLKLGSDASKTSTKKAWTFSKKTATYKQTTSAGYTLASDKKSIDYTKAASKTLATVNGVKSSDGLSLKGTTITVSKAALGTDKVTVGDGYTFALDKGVTKSTVTEKWSVSKKTATLNQTTKAGYSLADDKQTISYNKASSKKLATVEGVTTTKGLSVDSNVITLKKSSLSSKVTINGDYEFNFASGDYKKTLVTGSKSKDVITSSGKNLSIDGGAGNDTIKISGSATTITGGNGNDSIAGNGKGNIFVYANGDGNDVITGFSENDTIKIASGTAKISTSGDDVVFKIGKGKITLKNAKGKSVSYLAANGVEHTYPETLKFNSKNTAVTLLSGFMKDSFNFADYGSLLQNTDASKVLHEIKITGNKLANNIVGSGQDDYIDGGTGADTLSGGNGNDTIVGDKGNDVITGGKGNDSLSGGAGADIFIYTKGDGNDTITDYAEDDTIQINSDSVSKVSTSKKDIVLTLASKGKIVVTGGKDKVITYLDDKGEHTYPKTVTFNKAGTTATILSNYTKDTFNIADHGDYNNSVVTIDASDANHGLNIIANKNNNSIKGSVGNDILDGGKGNDTLVGSTGNDTLKGGAGSDVFFYSSGDGNDVIADFTKEDKIVVASGTVSNVSTKSKDVTFKIGSGKITVKDAANQVFPIYDSSNKILIYYDQGSAFMEDDEEVLTVNNNSLSELVEDKSYAALGSTDMTLNLTTDKNFVPVIAQASKK